MDRSKASVAYCFDDFSKRIENQDGLLYPPAGWVYTFVFLNLTIKDFHMEWTSSNNSIVKPL